MSAPDHLPTPCPCCGATSVAPEGNAAALLAVCDVLVIKALEQLGREVCRNVRGRFAQLDGRPWHIAHTLWPIDDSKVAKVLRTAWDVVPGLLSTHSDSRVEADDVVAVLDRYVHDLAITGTEHCIDDLAYRFESRLGLPVYLRHAEAARA